jgi:WhiB family transcriptional regulator, redox-sensing transcriptional regulator
VTHPEGRLPGHLVPTETTSSYRRRLPRPRPVDGIGKRSPLGLPCHRHDPDLWFAESPAELERAKALCRPCPVQRECLTGALRRQEPFGVWGGQIVLSGRVVPRKRGRGRPRKDAPPLTWDDPVPASA